MDHDVIVVGTRAAGAATAMLLARAGLRVLAVDRARFPSDTLSTHQVQVPGIARLRRWGVLDRIAAVTPAVPTVRLDTGGSALHGRYPAVDGVDALYGPRRTLLDAALVDAARGGGRRGPRRLRGRRTDPRRQRPGNRHPRQRTRGGEGEGPLCRARHRNRPAGDRRRRQAVHHRRGGRRARLPRAAAGDVRLLHLLVGGRPSGRRDPRPARVDRSGVSHQRRARDGRAVRAAGRLRPVPGRSGRRATRPRSTAAAATSASGSGPGRGPSRSGWRPTCPTASGRRTVRAGPWSAMPAW